MDDFLGIALVGVVLSIAFEFIQRRFEMGSTASKTAIVALSVVVGGGYYFVRETSLYEPILGVLASASTVYAFVFAGKSHSGGDYEA